MKSENKTAVEQLNELKAKADALPAELEAAMLSGNIQKYRELSALQVQLQEDIQILTLAANQERIEAVQNQINELDSKRQTVGKEFEVLEQDFNTAREAMNQKAHERQQLSMQALGLSQTIGKLKMENENIQQKRESALRAQFRRFITS